jgi:hypothetical protein
LLHKALWSLHKLGELMVLLELNPEVLAAHKEGFQAKVPDEAKVSGGDLMYEDLTMYVVPTSPDLLEWV